MAKADEIDLPQNQRDLIGCGNRFVTTGGHICGALDLIERDESGGRNVRNYRFDRHHTASGYWQITNATWRIYARRAKIKLSRYPTARSAPKAVQRRVAALIYKNKGFRPWAPFNERLRADLARHRWRLVAQSDIP